MKEAVIYSILSFLFFIFRYILISGSLYLYFWKLRKYKFEKVRIQKYLPSNKKIFDEIKWSISTFLIFSLVGIFTYIAVRDGKTRMYTNIEEYGYIYFFGSIAFMLFLHDAYFYFTHKVLHSKLLFEKFHKVHHLSTNPSPWAAFSFHPLEAVIESLIVPLIIFLLPSHPTAILIFLICMTVMNSLGHLGYELYPKGFTKHKLFKYSNTATHHNMHHKYFNCNYGLYLNIWDNWFNTNHEKYHEVYENVKSGKFDSFNKIENNNLDKELTLK